MGFGNDTYRSEGINEITNAADEFSLAEEKAV